MPELRETAGNNEVQRFLLWCADKNSSSRMLHSSRNSKAVFDQESLKPEKTSPNPENLYFPHSSPSPNLTGVSVKIGNTVSDSPACEVACLSAEAHLCPGDAHRRLGNVRQHNTLLQRALSPTEAALWCSPDSSMWSTQARVYGCCAAVYVGPYYSLPHKIAVKSSGTDNSSPLPQDCCVSKKNVSDQSLCIYYINMNIMRPENILTIISWDSCLLLLTAG